MEMFPLAANPGMKQSVGYSSHRAGGIFARDVVALQLKADKSGI